MTGKSLRNTIPLAYSIVSFLSLYLMTKFQSPLWFFLILFVWIGFSVAISVFVRALQTDSDKNLLSLFLSVVISSSLLLVVLEFTRLRQFYILIVTALMAVLSYWGTGAGDIIFHRGKPFRRFVVITWTMIHYAFSTTIFAILTFFPNSPWRFLLILLSGIVSGAIAIMVWERYYSARPKSFILWSLVFALSMMEIVGVMQLLPLAYVALGFIVTWIWYLLLLFVRFHLSEKGIIWKKQRVFIATNVILFIVMMLFFFRWF